MRLEWHITHDKLTYYMQALAKASDRITIENRGTTYEGRPLVLLTITSPNNHQNLETIRAAHVALTKDGASSIDVSAQPIVVYQGFSIHGNEPSGSNAALAVAYYLAAAQGSEINQLLNDVVILFDPHSIRRATTLFDLGQHAQSPNINPDSNDREYDEVWPGTYQPLLV